MVLILVVRYIDSLGDLAKFLLAPLVGLSIRIPRGLAVVSVVIIL
jgi:hypothetical protein